MNPSKHKMSVLSQILKLIPGNWIPKLAYEHGIDKLSRTFTPTSHVLALVFGLLSHALGLNDICDALRNLECCGTAGGKTRMRAAPEMTYLPELAPT